MNEVYRKEKKFLINIEEQKKYSAWLEKIMMQDEHNGAEGYIIRSLYPLQPLVSRKNCDLTALRRGFEG